MEFRFPGMPDVRCAFQRRVEPCVDDPASGGTIAFAPGRDPEAVRASRSGLLAALSRRGARTWAETRQVHGDTMLEMSAGPEPAALADQRSDALPEADGMATSTPGLALLIKTADCQPILLAHRSGRHVAAIHAGWRGNRCGFPASAVERFCAHRGLSPADIFAVRGPSLGPANAEFINFEREWGDEYRPWFDAQTRCMDLWRLTRSQLEAAGVPPGQIFGVDLCTALNPALFFSHRRDQRSGRQASLIWIAA